MKKFIGILLEILLVIFVMAIGLLAYLTAHEYNPQEVENVQIEGLTSSKVSIGKDLSILSWNIGYSALGKNQDFVMDGGGNVPPADKAQVMEYFEGIKSIIKKQKADINLIQEFDLNSTRSFYIDMRDDLSKRNSTFAYNYKCNFVPFPFPPLAKVESGIFTTSDYRINNAKRVSVPCPFSWPLSTANLKRCLLVSYFPIENSNKQLVVINLHLEAYSDNEARIVQLKKLTSIMQEEYAKGNYVIAGGDFNQIFPNTEALYPNTHKDNWDPNSLENNMLSNGFKFIYDSSTPTCRLLNQPYNPADTVGTQYYVIDGFIVSPNVKIISVNTLDAGFVNSDHNPVKLVFQLSK